jgi:hypothetical protein
MQAFGIISKSCNYMHQLFLSLQYLHTPNITKKLKFLAHPHRVACVSQSTSELTAPYQMVTFPVFGLYPFQFITLTFPPLNTEVLRYHDYSAINIICIFIQKKFLAKIQILNNWHTKIVSVSFSNMDYNYFNTVVPSTPKSSSRQLDTVPNKAVPSTYCEFHFLISRYAIPIAKTMLKSSNACSSISKTNHTRNIQTIQCRTSMP